MQPPTCQCLRIRSPSDANVVFHAVYKNILPIVTRRLDNEERRAISSGRVFVWEERGSSSDTAGGIERWTDSIHWGPSRVKDEFLFYQERAPSLMEIDATSDSDTVSQSAPRHGIPPKNLIKQTYSVFVNTPRGKRKWHLIAYFTADTLHSLPTIDDIPILASLTVTPGTYVSARRTPRSASHYAHASQGRITFRYHLLEPLVYLTALPPPPRHPLDEKALMSLTSRPWHGFL